MALLEGGFWPNALLGLASFKRPGLLGQVQQQQRYQSGQERQAIEDQRRREIEDLKKQQLLRQISGQRELTGLLGTDPNMAGSLLYGQTPQQQQSLLASAALKAGEPGLVKDYFESKFTTQQPGAFGGKSLDAQMYNQYLTLEKKRATQGLNKDEQLIYNTVRRRLEAPKTVGTPETGFTQVQQPKLPSYGQQMESQVPKVTEVTKPSRPLPPKAVEDLTSASKIAEQFLGLNSSFKEGYGGYVFEKAGDVANWTTRNLGFGDTARADWWQQYQERKNEIRNKFFGSALTETEKAEFDKAQINPGMKDDQIRINLARQSRALKAAADKLANVYKISGYTPEAVEAATKIDVPKTPVKTGTYKGRRVIQYSDGSIEYAN